jgi:predicted site-specific integrase-resolvase
MVGSARKHHMKKRVAIYLRVSTSKQDTDNQLRELSAVADGQDGRFGKSMKTPASAAPRAGINVLGSTP